MGMEEQIPMDREVVRTGPWAKSTGLALLATGVLLAGAAWGGLASITQASAPPAAAASAPPIAHPVAAGRDSYADVVTATQVIAHSSRYPSRIEIPVVPL